MKDIEFISSIIDKRAEELTEIATKIWEFAELPYEEFNSSKLLIDKLKLEGFEVVEGAAGIPTAFTAKWGEGKPVFGFLGEFDALDSLSQTREMTIKYPVQEGAPGHGCGHNVLGTGSLGAVLAVKDYIMETQGKGTVMYFGCPAEEGAGSKQFMARAGVFDGVDFVYTWHPSDITQVQNDRTVAIMGANFRFAGITAHAGSTPHLGRSALDAAELMSVGVNYLREHMIDQARIHYAYSDTGGTAPNVVQDRAVVKYEVRSPKVRQVKELFERVIDVAKGAALMTGTSMDYEITMAFSDYITNDALAEIADQALKDVGAPVWDEADFKLAKEYLESFNQITKDLTKEKIIHRFGVEQLDEVYQRPLDSTITPYLGGSQSYVSGSTDVGDVSYTVPTLNFNVATAFIGNVGHTWQMTGQSGSRIAIKGMLTAAKAMALSALRTAESSDVIEAAKNIVKIQNGGSYQCPLPDYVKPPIGKY